MLKYYLLRRQSWYNRQVPTHGVLMNIITIRGGRKHQRKLVREVMDFCLRKLLPRTTTLDINVRLNPRIEEVEGFCLCEDRNTFELEMDSRMPTDELIRTICHEMVHVRQYFKRELRDMYGNKKAWKTRVYNEDRTDYLDLPWEKEAFKLQDILYEEFIESDTSSDQSLKKSMYILG